METGVAQKRVLVVEDERLIRLIVAESLCAAGFEVVEAADGDEAVSLLGEPGHFDLLLTDIQMPSQADGNMVATCARVRYPKLPVIYTTGRPDTLTNEVRAGDLVLPKPFGVAEMVRAVVRLLSTGS